jgi:hypothetical protein
MFQTNMSSNHQSSPPLRFFVEFWDSPRVGYNTGLGVANARKYALYTAKAYGGNAFCEYADGASEEIYNPRNRN